MTVRHTTKPLDSVHRTGLPVRTRYPLSTTTLWPLRPAVRCTRRPPRQVSAGGGTIAEDLLDEKGKMQCTSCHDVHNTGVSTAEVDHHGPDDNDPWKSVRHMYFDSRVKLCKVCHNK